MGPVELPVTVGFTGAALLRAVAQYSVTGRDGQQLSASFCLHEGVWPCPGACPMLHHALLRGHASAGGVEQRSDKGTADEMGR